MPGLTQHPSSALGVDHPVDNGEIAGNVALFTAKAAVQDSDHLRRRLNAALIGKQKTVYHPAM